MMRGWMLALLPAAVPAAAQTNTGQISGTIKDTSGAVLPGVAVTITKVNTYSEGGDDPETPRELQCLRFEF